MSALDLPHSIVERVARGRPFEATGDPALIASHIAGLPAALARRPRLIGLSAAALAVPVPLLAIPVALAISGLVQPFGFAALCAPMLLSGLLAAGVWATREAWPEPWTLRHVVDLLPRVAWAPGAPVKVYAEMPRFFYTAHTLWRVEGTLAGGHQLQAGAYDHSQKQALSSRREGRRRIVTYRVWDRVSEEVLVSPAPHLRVRAMSEGAAVLDAMHFAPEEARVTPDGIGWVTRADRWGDSRGKDIAETLRALLVALGDTEASRAGSAAAVPAVYRPARWPFYVWGGLIGVYAAALALALPLTLAYVLVPRVGPLSALAPIEMTSASLAIGSAGALLSLAGALVTAGLLVREARIRS